MAVRQLIEKFQQRQAPVPKQPGVYRWWFEKSAAQQLLSPLTGVSEERILKTQIDGREWWCLYFGISRDLHMRFRWHALQHHSESSVRHGFLSTLRLTVGALRKVKASEAEEEVNNVLHKCIWDWCPTATTEEAKSTEEQTLANGYYPLNVQHNKGVEAQVVRQLKKQRKEYRN